MYKFLTSSIILPFVILTNRSVRESQVTSEIEELSQWERPTEECKRLLVKCASKIVLHYRDVSDAKKFFFRIATLLGDVASSCVVENGMGCVLLLSEIVSCLKNDSTWNWEQKIFPDLPNVAKSEWNDD